MRLQRALASVAVLLAFAVVVLGAYVRLSDAGLGCPDWPGCYGKLTPARAAPDIARTIAAQGGEHGPVSHAKAWKEMGHRYVAGTLGLLILAMAVLAWLRRESRLLATATLAVVAVQATLGMWTVTLLLKPAIVTAHLLGGMTTLALLVWLALAQRQYRPAPQLRALRVPAALAMGAIVAQVALGGWVSANYAALACPDLPLCLGQALPPMDFANAFHLRRELGMTSDGALLSLEALTAIHWTHRVFALVAVAAAGWVAWRARRVSESRALAVLLASALALQFSLGIANVLAGLPLWLAAAHNAGAALLLACLVVLNFFSFKQLRPQRA